jgi:hypothetical protein
MNSGGDDMDGGSTSVVGESSVSSDDESTSSASMTTTSSPLTGERVRAEEMTETFGSPVLAINFAEEPAFGCGDEGCTYPGGFEYQPPPEPVEFAEIGDCQSSGYTPGIDEPINIRETFHDAVFWTHRWGNVEYRIGVEPAEYLVVLRFAELDVVGTPEARDFTVVVEGLESNSIDIKAAVGLDTALDLAWQVEVTDGQLNVRMIPGQNDCPALHGLVVFEAPVS